MFGSADLQRSYRTVARGIGVIWPPTCLGPKPRRGPSNFGTVLRTLDPTSGVCGRKVGSEDHPERRPGRRGAITEVYRSLTTMTNPVGGRSLFSLPYGRGFRRHRLATLRRPCFNTATVVVVIRATSTPMNGRVESNNRSTNPPPLF